MRDPGVGWMPQVWVGCRQVLVEEEGEWECDEEDDPQIAPESDQDDDEGKQSAKENDAKNAKINQDKYKTIH